MKNQVEVRGSTAAIKIIRRGCLVLETLVDVSDLPAIDAAFSSVSAHFCPRSENFYAIGYAWRSGSDVQERLSRFLMAAPREMVVDHINHDTMDNTRSNLRIVDVSANALNRKGPRAGSKAGYIGVSWCEVKQRWQAERRIAGVRYYLGQFRDKAEAIKRVERFNASFPGPDAA